MIVERRIAPPNSLVLLVSAAEPEIVVGVDSAVGASATCLAVGTLSEIDGPTDITLTDEEVALDGLAELYRGDMDTGLRRVALQTVEGDQLGEIAVSDVRTPVAVFGSDDFEPDRLVLKIG